MLTFPFVFQYAQYLVYTALNQLMIGYPIRRVRTIHAGRSGLLIRYDSRVDNKLTNFYWHDN
jgi:hypothetical protein